MDAFNKFLSVNGLKKGEVASFLDVSSAFITQVSTGKSKLSPAKIKLIKGNRKWDTSMFGQSESAGQLHGLDVSGLVHVPALNMRSTIEKAAKADDSLVGYLKAEIASLKAQISQLQNEKSDLNKQVGMLEAKIELLTDGRMKVSFITPEDAK